MQEQNIGQLVKSALKKPGILDAQEIHTRRMVGKMSQDFYHYQCNEFYPALAEPLKELGGVGIAVGTDQPLDFFIMGNLEKMYAVDIDPYASLITLAYLEIGSRLHRILGERYPTIEEYIHMFSDENIELTRRLLAIPTPEYIFYPKDLETLGEIFKGNYGRPVPFHTYLTEKMESYGKTSWIGADSNLARVIQAYEEGRIVPCRDSITGSILPDIASELQKSGEKVSLVYTSNAPMHEEYRELYQLPFAENAQIISTVLPEGITALKPSKQVLIRGDRHWIYLMFSPQEHNEWPTIHEGSPYTFEELIPGLPGFYSVKKLVFTS